MQEDEKAFHCLKKREDFFGCRYDAADQSHERSLPVRENIAPSILKSTSEKLLAAVFPDCGKVFGKAASVLLGAMTDKGRPLVRSLAEKLRGGRTSQKGCQERVSGWLERYDFAGPIDRWLWNTALSTVERDTVIALDGGDISKEFGGRGMEGMEMGRDGSRGVVAMGHNLLGAAVVNASRARALCLKLLKGRRGLPRAERELLSAIAAATLGNGIAACDRGFDSRDFVDHAAGLPIRTVVRIKELDRDVFGTGRSIPRDMDSAPGCSVTLQSPTRRQSAHVRWREGVFPGHGGCYHPVLVVSSTFDGCTLHFYGIGFGPFASPEERRSAAVAVANAYFCRWSVEVLYQDLKQVFGLEKARVRTFKRLQNLVALCALAYAALAHYLPTCGDAAIRLAKAMKDNFGALNLPFRPYVANLRELLRMTAIRCITGRPPKRRPPSLTPLLPGFS